MSIYLFHVEKASEKYEPLRFYSTADTREIDIFFIKAIAELLQRSSFVTCPTSVFLWLVLRISNPYPSVNIKQNMKANLNSRESNSSASQALGNF